MSLNFSVRLVDSDSSIRQQILIGMRDYLSRSFSRAIPSIRSSIQNIVRNAIVSQPEYSALINGRLTYELGIPNAASRVNNIIGIWIENIDFEVIPLTIGASGIKGGFKINMIRSDYQDVITSDDAIVVDSLSGKVVPWLEWLLLYGGKILVRNYTVKLGPNSRSRTGLAIMQESNENWRMPPEFAGTADNNWITRGLQNIDDQFLNNIQKEIEKFI